MIFSGEMTVDSASFLFLGVVSGEETLGDDLEAIRLPDAFGFLAAVFFIEANPSGAMGLKRAFSFPLKSLILIILGLLVLCLRYTSQTIIISKGCLPEGYRSSF